MKLRIICLLLTSLCISSCALYKTPYAKNDPTWPNFKQRAPEVIDGSFAMVVLPDTQVYAEHHPKVLKRQIDWIIKNHQAYNIKYVLHVGDIVNNNNDKEWLIAKQAFSRLAKELPFAIALGNHDMGPEGKGESRDSLYEKYFENLATMNPSYSKGTYRQAPDSLANTYHTFYANGRDWLILSIEMCPRDNVLKWANNVIDAHPSHSVILLTHAYINSKGRQFVREIKPQGDGNYPICLETNTNDGLEVWTKLVSKHRNFALTMNGHFVPPLQSLASRGDEGNIVHQMLVNYQDQRYGGQGYLRLMQFLEDAKTVKVQDYSPLLNRTRTHPSANFTLRINS